MEIILAIATLLGGISAAAYFWDRFRGNKAGTPPLEVAQAGGQSWSKIQIEQEIQKSDPKSDWSPLSKDWGTVTTFKRDVNLRFEIRYSEEGIQRDDFREEWANKHPDSHATGYWCDLYYGSSLIERFVLVSVDGGRALLPIPKEGSDRFHRTQVLPLDYKVAEIHDIRGSLPEYMERSGLVIVG